MKLSASGVVPPVGIVPLPEGVVPVSPPEGAVMPVVGEVIDRRTGEFTRELGGS